MNFEYFLENIKKRKKKKNKKWLKLFFFKFLNKNNKINSKD